MSLHATSGFSQRVLLILLETKLREKMQSSRSKHVLARRQAFLRLSAFSSAVKKKLANTCEKEAHGGDSVQ